MLQGGYPSGPYQLGICCGAVDRQIVDGSRVAWRACISGPGPRLSTIRLYGALPGHCSTTAVRPLPTPLHVGETCHYIVEHVTE